MTPEQAAAEIVKVADWLDECAAADEARAKDRTFPSFADACAHDARTRRRASKNLRAALAALRGPA